MKHDGNVNEEIDGVIDRRPASFSYFLDFDLLVLQSTGFSSIRVPWEVSSNKQVLCEEPRRFKLVDPLSFKGTMDEFESC